MMGTNLLSNYSQRSQITSLCRVVSYLSPDNRTRQDPVRRRAAWSPAALWRFCFRTSHDCGTQAEVEGPSAGVWQNPHEPQGLTGSVSWTVLLCYSSSRGHLWQRWKNLHRNWLVTVTVSGAGPPDGSAMNVVNHSLIDAWLLPQLILVHCSTCTAFLLAAAWCVHERRLIAD